MVCPFGIEASLFWRQPDMSLRRLDGEIKVPIERE